MELSSSDLKEIDESGIIWKTWSKLQVECVQGCNWIGSTLEFQSHTKGCSLHHLEQQKQNGLNTDESQHDSLNSSRNMTDNIQILISDDAIELCL